MTTEMTETALAPAKPPAEVSTAARPAAGEPATSSTRVHLRVFRGEAGGPSRYEDFDVPVEEGMVVLDALHWIQGNEAPDLAVRWNCKAAKCGSCSAEVNGRPRLTCKTRLSDFEVGEDITVEPMRAFPLIRDLVTDVSWNYAVNKSITPFSPPDGVPQAEWRWQQQDIERVQEFRKCIECFLCQDVCHVLRNHETERPFMGPRFLVRAAGLEMHPIDQADRRSYLKDVGGVGYCNITKCCTEVCPEHIKITDNAIIPLKERVADEYYDPIQWVWRKLRGDQAPPSRAELPVLPAQAVARDADVAAGAAGAALPAEPAPPALSTDASADRVARAVGRDRDAEPARPAAPAEDVRGDADSAEPMASPAPTTGVAEPPAKVARAARSKAKTPPAPKRPTRRRSDAGDETPSEG
jgi:succinate dehydrogenase / fumarate reductase, iron-sulfur subunit